MTATIQQWEEWRARCAILRCAEPARSALRGFAWARFVRYAGHAIGEAGVRGRVPSAADCWHLLESHLAVARPRSGRRYKEWLFARLENADDPPLHVIQSGASLLIRSVVRDWVLAETPPPATQSLDAPIGPDGAGFTLADLLPAVDGDDAIEGEEIDRAAAALLPGFLDALDGPARLVLLAKRLGLPLYDPAVLKLAGVGRSRVSTIWRGVFIRLARLVRERHAGEAHDWQLKLTLRATQRLNEQIFLWGRVEKTAQPLFFIVERGGCAGTAQGRRRLEA